MGLRLSMASLLSIKQPRPWSQQSVSQQSQLHLTLDCAGILWVWHGWCFRVSAGGSLSIEYQFSCAFHMQLEADNKATLLTAQFRA